MVVKNNKRRSIDRHLVPGVGIKHILITSISQSIWKTYGKHFEKSTSIMRPIPGSVSCALPTSHSFPMWNATNPNCAGCKGGKFAMLSGCKDTDFLRHGKTFFRVPPRSVSSSGWEGAGKTLFNLSNSRGEDGHSLINQLVIIVVVHLYGES